MISKIEDNEVYKLRGYTIEGIIELAYNFGKTDERWKPEVDQTKNSKEICIKQLLEFFSFQELND